MTTIMEPAREIPVRYEAELCVVGGSCTGVFAAVRAARLGARVVLAERENRLGGTATAGLVNIWHSLYDTENRQQVIAGLTQEVTSRLVKGGFAQLAVSESAAIRFDPMRLAGELDALVREHRIRVLLHTFCTGLLRREDGGVDAVLAENKDGRFAIRAACFVDASGDGDLFRALGVPMYRHTRLQPPSACFLMTGHTTQEQIARLVTEHGAEFGLDDDWGWFGTVPGIPSLSFRADNHIFDVDCSQGEALTFAEMEGRRKAFALTDLLRKYASADYAVANLCSSVGIRETVHYRTAFEATEQALLTGARYDDAVLQGTYRVDIHHANDRGITFRYLDGRSETILGKNGPTVEGNWREDAGLTGDPPTFYQLPFRALLAPGVPNCLAAGRMLHADEGAFGALRVMVNLNQLGEAAGTAAYLAAARGLPLERISGTEVRWLLRAGGSAL